MTPICVKPTEEAKRKPSDPAAKAAAVRLDLVTPCPLT